ncbi:DUF305 domain-containing protein [Streptomyces pinistramenti]|uniref:DUF305 domain-containing protein n=1 Tax=Streptomyces pinistramenti TaxID=2884812 RepID=UPI001D093536|nr:DUF305 domain-containing protein [Streptomyces pinistramenti]MCB5907370.1 DUF305 domain-containing protein [Streptomyces pinistramenti]
MTARRSLARRSLNRRATAVAAAATAAVLLAACGSNDKAAPSGDGKGSMASTPSAAAAASHGTHNAQDVAFAQGMIPHHRQAVAMAELAPSRTKSAQLKELAAKIEKAQGPEISTMSGWLKGWGESVPSGEMPEMKGMDHSGGGMPGMMSDGDMKKLDKLSGAAFDTAFLKMMVGHHQGALDMAKTELSKGAYGPAKDLAKSINASQSAEIAQMKKSLGES